MFISKSKDVKSSRAISSGSLNRRRRLPIRKWKKENSIELSFFISHFFILFLFFVYNSEGNIYTVLNDI